jgi:hypothetical protein
VVAGRLDSRVLVEQTRACSISIRSADGSGRPDELLFESPTAKRAQAWSPFGTYDPPTREDL